MRWFRKTDPIDVVLGDEPGDGDFAEVAAIVHEMRSAYLPAERPAPSEALAAFAALEEGERPLRANRPLVAQRQVTPSAAASRPERIPHMRKTVAAFAATITGKIVLGTAVAAAAVGGAAVTDNLPELPSQTEDAHIVESAGDPDLPEQADNANTEEGPGTESHDPEGPSEDAFGNNAEGDVPSDVTAFLDGLEEWVRCVQGNAAAQGDESERTEGQFDPSDGCPERPENPGQGEGGPSATAGDNANSNATEGQSNAEQGAENGDTSDTPAPAEQGDAKGGPETADEQPPTEAGAPSEAGASSDHRP